MAEEDVMDSVRLQKLFRKLQRQVHSPEHQVVIHYTSCRTNRASGLQYITYPIYFCRWIVVNVVNGDCKDAQPKVMNRYLGELGIFLFSPPLLHWLSLTLQCINCNPWMKMDPMKEKLKLKRFHCSELNVDCCVAVGVECRLLSSDADNPTTRSNSTRKTLCKQI